MTQTMVEKLARAIAHPVYVRSFPGLSEDVIQRYVDINWSEHVDQAEAALLALMEPTEGMAKAGFDGGLEATYEHDEFATPSMVSAIFTAMIQAAIDEVGE